MTTTFLGRPAFKLGEQFMPLIQPIKPQLPKRRRLLDPEGRLRRPAFRLPGPKPRALQTIEGIEALKVKQEGIKIRFGDKLLGKVKVAKRDSDGNIVKDEQGNTVFEERPFNFGLLAEILDNTLKQNISKAVSLAARIKAGSADAPAARRDAAVVLSAILDDNSNISRFDLSDMRDMGISINSLNIPRDPNLAGFGPGVLIDNRFITSEQWAIPNTAGPAMVYLVSQATRDPRLSVVNPVFGELGEPIPMVGIIGEMGRGGTMDLISRRISRDLATARNRAGITSTPLISDLESQSPIFSIITDTSPTKSQSSVMSSFATGEEQISMVQPEFSVASDITPSGVVSSFSGTEEQIPMRQPPPFIPPSASVLSRADDDLRRQLRRLQSVSAAGQSSIQAPSRQLSIPRGLQQPPSVPAHVQREIDARALRRFQAMQANVMGLSLTGRRQTIRPPTIGSVVSTMT